MERVTDYRNRISHLTESNNPPVSTCPATGHITRRDTGQPFAIPNGQATWWHCSACGGWHASLSELERH